MIHRGSVDNRCSMVSRSSMDNRCSMVGRGSMVSRGSVVSRGLRVGSSSFIGDISNISFIAISLVVNMLGTAIRKSNRVGSCSIASTITSLSSVECSLGVVISNSVSVGVGRRNIRVSWLSMIGRGSMDNWGMVGWGGMDNSHRVGNSYWMSYSMVSKNSSMMESMTKELRSSRSCGKESSKTGKRLHVVVWCF